MDMYDVLDGASKVVAGASALAAVLFGYVNFRGEDKVSKALKMVQGVLGMLALNFGARRK